MPMALPLGEVRGLVQDYGLSLEMQEMVLALEGEVLPMLQKRHKEMTTKGRGR